MPTPRRYSVGGAIGGGVGEGLSKIGELINAYAGKQQENNLIMQRQSALSQQNYAQTLMDQMAKDPALARRVAQSGLDKKLGIDASMYQPTPEDISGGVIKDINSAKNPTEVPDESNIAAHVQAQGGNATPVFGQMKQPPSPLPSTVTDGQGQPQQDTTLPSTQFGPTQTPQISKLTQLGQNRVAQFDAEDKSKATQAGNMAYAEATGRNKAGAENLPNVLNEEQRKSDITLKREKILQDQRLAAEEHMRLLTRGDAREDASFKYNNDALTKTAAPYVKQLGELDRARSSLLKGTAAADAILVPQVLRALIGAGEVGSGFRMTNAEIQQALHGRTTFEDLDATIRKWSLSPQTEQIPPEQRAALLDLINDGMKKADSTLSLVDKAQRDLISSHDPNQHRLITQGVGELIHKQYGVAPTTQAAPTDPTQTPLPPSVGSLLSRKRN